MSADWLTATAQPTVLGFDPGRQKCGVAVMGVDRALYYFQVVRAAAVLETVQHLRSTYPISLIVMGDQTASTEWRHRLTTAMNGALLVVLVDERNTTLEARDRYWQMFPPSGLYQLVPKVLRRIPRPIDDIVAILLIERYLKQLTDPM